MDSYAKMYLDESCGDIDDFVNKVKDDGYLRMVVISHLNTFRGIGNAEQFLDNWIKGKMTGENVDG